jgi:hypothetical protein
MMTMPTTSSGDEEVKPSSYPAGCDKPKNLQE